MKALTWQGKRNVRVDDVPDPVLKEDTDAIIKVTSTGICGSDLHLYEIMGPFLDEGDILGHEAMGIVEEVGSNVTNLKPADRVVVPFNVSCGNCFMCRQGLYSQCETTQVHEHGTGAALFGYTKLYGHVSGGQAEYLHIPFADTLPIKVPKGPPDDRFVYLSDVLPTAWQAVRYANTKESIVVLGLGPIGDMATRVAKHLGVETIIGIDLVPERLSRVNARGITTLNVDDADLMARIRDLTDGRGPEAVIDAVGMEAHGAPIAKIATQAVGLLPDAIAGRLMQTAGFDRLHALKSAIEIVRRGGTISLAGVYSGMIDPLPMLTLFDKQIQLRMGQANVLRWIPEILPVLLDNDPFGTEEFATHHLPLEQAPHGYEIFQKKEDNAVKVLLQP